MREQMDSAARAKGGATRKNLIGFSVAHLFRNRHDRTQSGLPHGYHIVQPARARRNPDRGLQIRRPGIYGAEVCPQLPRRREPTGLLEAVLLGHPAAIWAAERWSQLRALVTRGEGCK